MKDKSFSFLFLNFWEYLLVSLVSCVLSQDGPPPDIPQHARGNLSVTIVVKYPEDSLEQHGYADAPFYLYGNGLCLSWDEGTQMEHTLEDTWELTLTYTQTTGGYGCDESSIDRLVGVNKKFEYRVVLSDTLDMLGANCGSNLPISMSSPLYQQPQEIYCNPWFFSTGGFTVVERVFGEPELIKGRNMHFYLPPSFGETVYKKYPVVFGVDLGLGLLAFSLYDTMEAIVPLLDDMIVTFAIMDEIIVVGTADYRPLKKNIFIPDRYDLLGPVNPTYAKLCTNGTFFDGCGGCFNVSEIDGWVDIIYVMGPGGCGSDQPIGGQADTFLDFLLNEVMEMISTIAGDRALTDQQHLGITGCSMGGLFSCYAAWTRPDVFANAACQSSAFWWPENITGDPQNDFENIHIGNHREDRPFQKIFMDVSYPGDFYPKWRTEDASRNLANSMAELSVFQWNRNLWLDVYVGQDHGFEECYGRAWVPMSEFYKPIGGPRNSNSNPSKVRTDHIQRMWRQTNECKTEEYMAHITKDRFKEHLKIAKEFV